MTVSFLLYNVDGNILIILFFLDYISAVSLDMTLTWIFSFPIKSLQQKYEYHHNMYAHNVHI